MAASSGQAASLPDSTPFGRDIVAGLTSDPKQLPSKYHYDALGSQLFEAICELPWYTITRSERRVLARAAPDVVRWLGRPATMIELGAGSGEKIAILAQALAARRGSAVIHLVDISKTALDMAQRTLGRYPAAVVQHHAPYLAGLRSAIEQVDDTLPVLVLLLGSNLGNLNPDAAMAFLADLRATLRAGDGLLLGADLVKPEAALIDAYDDPLGVTAAFNLNLLARINRELDADFDIRAFDHRVVWNQRDSRVESYLVSRCEQTVCLTAVDCCVRFAKNEAIWTESSHKYRPEQLVGMGAQVGLRRHAQWIEHDAAFALTLFEAP